MVALANQRDPLAAVISGPNKYLLMGFQMYVDRVPPATASIAQDPQLGAPQLRDRVRNAGIEEPLVDLPRSTTALEVEFTNEDLARFREGYRLVDPQDRANRQFPRRADLD